jgi:glucose-1-phosphate cytidylyltransferase
MVILAGGLGTRLSEETVSRPKPMVTIGGKPILWHIMKICGAAGIRDFVIALGHQGDVIREYLLHLPKMNTDFRVNVKSGAVVQLAASTTEDWTVTALETGEGTGTGGRIKAALEYLGVPRVMATYGDAVTNLDVRDVLKFHEENPALATVTAVRPPARFGYLDIDGPSVVRFGEKLQADAGWINGGFFVLESGVAEWIESSQTTFEAGPLTTLAQKGQLNAFRHDGFWQPMDTLRERNILEELWRGGAAPWKIWD